MCVVPFDFYQDQCRCSHSRSLRPPSSRRSFAVSSPAYSFVVPTSFSFHSFRFVAMELDDDVDFRSVFRILGTSFSRGLSFVRPKGVTPVSVPFGSQGSYPENRRRLRLSWTPGVTTPVRKERRWRTTEGSRTTRRGARGDGGRGTPSPTLSPLSHPCPPGWGSKSHKSRWGVCRRPEED